MGFIVSLRGGKKKFRCEKVDKEGVKFIRCRPVLEKDDILQNLSDSDIVFRINDGGKFELITDGGAYPEVIKELEDYLKYFS